MPFEISRRSSNEMERREAAKSVELELAQRPGRLAAARIESGSFATHVALTQVCMLSAAEEGAIQMAPLGEGRYRAVVDSFAGYCCQEIALLPHQK